MAQLVSLVSVDLVQFLMANTGLLFDLGDRHVCVVLTGRVERGRGFFEIKAFFQRQASREKKQNI